MTHHQQITNFWFFPLSSHLKTHRSCFEACALQLLHYFGVRNAVCWPLFFDLSKKHSQKRALIIWKKGRQGQKSVEIYLTIFWEKTKLEIVVDFRRKKMEVPAYVVLTFKKRGRKLDSGSKKRRFCATFGTLFGNNLEQLHIWGWINNIAAASLAHWYRPKSA